MLNQPHRSKLFWPVFSVALGMLSCSKDDPPPPKIDPIKISIVPVTDSLRNIPINFQAIVDRAPESYKWTFSDGKTFMDVSPTRTFDWGTYDVGCTVSYKGTTSFATYKLYIKGDARINGTRHFTGHYSYNKAPDVGGTPAINIERDIKDTILVVTSPEPHKVNVFGRTIQLNYDYANQIIYYEGPPQRADFKYYPGNDSTFISIAFPIGGGQGGELWTFWRKN